MRQLKNAQDTGQAIEKMADSIQSASADLSRLALVGIRTRGVFLANRIASAIQKKSKSEIPVGVLDITLYRDDLSRLSDHPVVKETEIPFSIDDKDVCLIDDVLYTGRTVRGALNALFDYGRPRSVTLGVLVDRGGREMPIQADFVGVKYEAKDGDNVHVKFTEVDGTDEIEVAKIA